LAWQRPAQQPRRAAARAGRAAEPGAAGPAVLDGHGDDGCSRERRCGRDGRGRLARAV